MYTLRTFTETSEVNNWLGDQYEVVRREESYERFADIYKKVFDKPHVADDDPKADEVSKRCYALITNQNEEPLPLYKGQSNYIVTPGGKTFSNLTYK